MTNLGIHFGNLREDRYGAGSRVVKIAVPPRLAAHIEQFAGEFRRGGTASLVIFLAIEFFLALVKGSSSDTQKVAEKLRSRYTTDNFHGTRLLKNLIANLGVAAETLGREES